MVLGHDRPSLLHIARKHRNLFHLDRMTLMCDKIILNFFLEQAVELLGLSSDFAEFDHVFLGLPAAGLLVEAEDEFSVGSLRDNVSVVNYLCLFLDLAIVLFA